jgi:alpha-beta hydrolase superfamily lysophospholipase
VTHATTRAAAVLLVACAVAAAGCAAPPDAPLRPLTAAAPTPAGVRHESGSFQAHDGLALFEQSWHPDGAARAVLVVHHGLKDHSDRYAPFAERMAKDGIAVYAYDMRGHGRSAGPRATFDHIDDLTADLAIFLERTRAREPRRPVFLLGHSVGGLVVTLFTLERKPPMAGLVVLAPALRVDAPLIQAAATPIAATLTPNAPVVDVPDSAFVRMPAEQAAMGADPFVYHPSGPARSGASVLDGIERVWARADSLDVPLLGLHGTVDQATDPRGTAELVSRARSRDKKLVLYRGVRHDLLHEPERDEIEGDIEQWLLAHLAERP